jgi:prevent-host-death family protein
MKTVRIAELKSHLSHHLRRVQAGEPLTVLDRNTPIARLVPLNALDDVVITKPAPGSPRIGSIKMPPASKLDFDVVDLLLEDRRRR